MEIMLVLEHHFCMDADGTVWCNRVVDYEYLKRYLQTFNKVYVCARMQKARVADKSWKKASGIGIEFIGLPDFTGIKGAVVNYRNIAKCIKNNINLVDGVIMRAPSVISMLMYDVIKRTGIPMAIEFVMAADKMIVNDNFVASMINAILKNKARTICREVAGVSYVTEHVLQKDYPCSGFTESYSSIDLHEDDFYKQNWNQSSIPDEYKLVHTGYMDDDRKGQEILIRAVDILIKKGYKIKLTLIGDGQNRVKLEKIVSALNIGNYVFFAGAITNKKKIFSVLKNSHLFVLPTKSEGLPRSILEAMAVGLPCVSSNVDGVPELLDERYCLSNFNPNEYAKVIGSLLDNWDEMIRVGNRNYAKALEYRKSELDCKRKYFYDEFSEYIIQKED
jgi:glycosyltransferase involved in cell wall biosynthesis